jgi:hypothetical protein
MNEQRDYSQFKDSILRWLCKVEARADGRVGRWKYNVGMCRDWAVESSATAVMLMESTGRLSQLEAATKQGIVCELQSWQDADTGLFIDPLIGEQDKVAEHHTWEHIWQHHTGCCVEALACLGASPVHPPPKQAFCELTEDSVEQCVLGLGWANPWMAGEHWFRMVESCRSAQGLAGSSMIAPVADKACSVLEKEIINPDTGLPDKMGCTDRRAAMAGLFKIMFGYLQMSRPIPFPERAIDSVLSLQVEDGGFGSDNMCIHWDAMWVLKNLNEQLEGRHRHEDISNAGSRLSDFLCRSHRKKDGGFSFFKDHCLAVHDSIRVSDPLPESDMVGSFMAFECLRYTEKWTGGDYRVYSPVELKWRRRNN